MTEVKSNKGRLEAFSDGVFAIIITIMVLELKAPVGTHLKDLAPLLPTFLSYVLSFAFVAIFWNNHHHLFQAVHRVNGKVLWANMLLLFWLSLVPMVTFWSDEDELAKAPAAVYGLVLTMAGLSYFLLTRTLVRLHGETSALAAAIGSDRRGKLSLLLCVVAVAAAFWHPMASNLLYVAVALIWAVPDPRIERMLGEKE